MKTMLMFIPLSISFMLLNHPISMGFNILMITIMISLSTGILNLTFWFSYILFLVVIGSLLILFIYMTSIASNEKFKFSLKITYVNILIITMISLFIYTNKQIDFNIKIMETNMFLSQINDNINMTNLKYYTPPFTLILISLMMYLLITLIMIVKITKKEKGPIRQK
uniref:NADH-ubiquinone oxidoreductase chain 6 n=1 Tax=Basilepta melanopus TaxID=2488261 RepID=A0A977K8J7_9CUCU|nr:NADH dehydrogenase subunit 6 [Basilepta melanopus]UXC97427.1 NADH dehydrogenase subunit 6 [Basilepta melanopus]